MAAAIVLLAASAANAADIKIALVYSKTGALEAYAKQTETGLRLGLEYATGGTMTIDGRKIALITKDDQFKPDLATAYNARGYVYLLTHDYQRALADFDDAIHLKPAYANAVQNRSVALKALGAAAR